MVHEAECGKHAADLLQRCMLREQCLHQPLVLHSDNGAPMKACIMKAKLDELGVLPSYSRPRVSNDNALSSPCSGCLNTGHSGPQAALPRWMKPGHGLSTLCAGTTPSIATARLTLLHQHSATKVKTRRC